MESEPKDFHTATHGSGIDFKYPGIAAWSVDHHVLTLAIRRGRWLSEDIAPVMDHIFDVLYSKQCAPEHSSTQYQHSAAVLVNVLFNSKIHDDYLVGHHRAWTQAMDWCMAAIESSMTPSIAVTST